jgi:CheY-like chemotaxis protein
VLDSESFTCWTADSAGDALRQIETQTNRPDVILLDVVMPGMPAVDFVNRFRQRSDGNATRIVFMTGLPTKNLPNSVQVDGYLRKPFTPGELFRAIRSGTEPRPPIPPG